MSESTPSISCPADEWTLVSDGNTGISFKWREEMVYGKWTFGAVMPDVDTLDYWTFGPKAPQNLNDLSVGAKIWVMPEGGEDLVLERVIP
jgi:hypothetical protein